MSLPYEHAMAAIDSRSENYQNYIEEFYSVDMYKKCYSKPIIMHALDRIQWVSNDVQMPRVLPPLYTIKAGRPQKKMKLSMDPNKEYKACSNYKRKGHNKRKCKYPVVCISKFPQCTSKMPPYIN